MICISLYLLSQFFNAFLDINLKNSSFDIKVLYDLQLLVIKK